VERVIGYTPEEMYADPEILLRVIHPDDREAFSHLYAGDDSQPTSWRFVARDGSLVWAEGRRIALRDADGQVIAFETVSRDVTAQMEAQLALEAALARERSLLEAIPDSIVEVDSAGRVLDFIPRDGTSPLPITDAVVGHLITELMPAEIGTLAMQRLAAALASQSVQAFRYRTGSGDGDQRVVEVRISPGAGQAVLVARELTDDLSARGRSGRSPRMDHDGDARGGRSENPYGLTFREFTVLGLVAEGRTDKEIAAELGISLFTVGKHVSNILGKMLVSSRTVACVRALQERVLG
jgi:PAS domain S-box-containing protein